MLRAVMPGEQVDAMRQAPRSTAPYAMPQPLVRLLGELRTRENVGHLRFEKDGYLLEIRGGAAQEWRP